MVYNFVREDGTIISEQLDILNERIIIRRDDSSAIIDNESINPPQNKLVLNIRRDIQKYPEIEKIMTWANNVVTVSFTKFDPIFPIFSQSSNPFELAKIVQELDDVSKKEFYNLVHEIGFELSSVKVLKGAQIVLFKEKGVDTILLENDLSNGMLRSISVLLYMIYFKMTGYPALLLIDDLCEGLDYDHSVKLGRKIFEFCSSNDIQLIATSNDAFLMDIVDIDNWCVLRRNGSAIVPLCRYDNTELFDHFALTGLSNFDFFASDYIDTYLRDTSKK